MKVTAMGWLLFAFLVAQAGFYFLFVNKGLVVDSETLEWSSPKGDVARKASPPPPVEPRLRPRASVESRCGADRPAAACGIKCNGTDADCPVGELCYGGFGPYSCENRSVELLILIGAQKSGTSDFLGKFSRHPCILAPPQELHFFDLPVEGGVGEVRRQYTSLFPQTTAKSRACCPSHLLFEKTPVYMASAYAPWAIRQYLPEAYFLARFRNPVTRMDSAFRQAVHRRENGTYLHRVQDEWDLLSQSALARQGWVYSRAAYEETYALVMRRYGLDNLVWRSLYDLHMESWLEAWPADRFLVDSYGSYAADPCGTLQRAAAYAGLDGALPAGCAGITCEDSSSRRKRRPIAPHVQAMIDEARPLVEKITAGVVERLRAVLRAHGMDADFDLDK